MDNNLLKTLLEKNSVWLLEAVDTKEASRISNIPEPTLITMRSRGGGPQFFSPRGTRLVRYFRIDIYLWLLADGFKANTSDPGTPLEFFLDYDDVNRVGAVVFPTGIGE